MHEGDVRRNNPDATGASTRVRRDSHVERAWGHGGDRSPETTMENEFGAFRMTVFDCAAVIGTKDRPAELAACLASLAAASPGSREVIVAEQGKGEAPSAPAGLPVTHLKLERTGLAYARNQALKRATAEWVFFPDDDCTVAPDLLTRASEALERLPDAGFLSGRVLAPGATAHADSPRVLAQPPEILKSMSAALFVQRTLLEELHGFDERFGVGSTYPSGEE